MEDARTGHRRLLQRNISAGPGCVVNINHATNFGISAGRKEKQGHLPIDAVLSKIYDLEKTFVRTEAMDQALETVKRYDHVTLVGAPGEGKTSISLMMCEEFHRLNYEILFVDDLDDFDENQCYTFISDTFIVIDDIFGTIGISTNLQKIDKTLNTLNEIIKRKLTQRPRDPRQNLESLSLGTRPEEVPVKVKVVFTSKTFNLNEGCSHLSKYNVNLFRKETIVDLSAKSLSKDAKRHILAKLQIEYPLTDLSEKSIREITEITIPVFGFPLISKLYFSEPLFQVQGIKFFQEPLYYLRSNIDSLIRENSTRKVILMLLVLCGGKLNLTSFQQDPESAVPKDVVTALNQIIPSVSLTSVYKDAVNFDGTYCVRQKQFISFSHPSIYDAVTCAMISLYPLLLLKHCTLKFIYERVRVNKQRDRSDIFLDPGSNIVYVTPDYHDLLITRISEHIKQGYFRLTLAHPMFKDKYLFLRLLDKIMKYLRDIVLSKDKESGESFLYWCTFSHNEFIVEQTLKCIRHVKEDVINSIKACIGNGNLKAMKLLIDQLCCQDNIPLQTLATSCKLLLVAATSGHVDIFKYLKDSDVDFQIKDENGKTVLHLCCEAGHSHIVDLIPVTLMKEFLHVQDYEGRTPLMLCAESGHLKLFKVLVEKGVDLTFTDHLSDTCLHLASAEGHSAVVEFLLIHETALLNQRGSQGRTPIMTAARYGRYEVFSLLLEGSDMTLTDDSNDNMLCLAAAGGSVDIVNTVLKFQDIDINKRGGYHRSAIMTAAMCGHGDVFDLLLSKNANISKMDICDNTLLHQACYGRNLGICKRVLTLKRDELHLKTAAGRNSLLIAAKEGSKEIVEFLLSHDADLNLTDNANNTTLHQACLHGDYPLVQYLLDLNAFDVHQRGRFGWTPLMVSARVGHEDVLQLLLSHGSVVDLKDDNGNDLLWLACCGGNASIVKHLISLRRFNVNRRGESGYTPAMAAAKKGQKETFDVTVAVDADLRLTDDHENNVLTLAAAGGNASIVRYLLTLNMFDINKRGEAGRTPIMAAARKGNTEIIQILVEEGADISLTDRQKNNCLCLASKSDEGLAVPYLMSLKKLDLNWRGELNRSPVMIAANTGNVGAFNALLSQNVDILGTDDLDNDCLGLAARGGSAAIVRRLLELKIFDINRQAHRGYTPVMQAILRGHLKVFELLVTGGADVSVDCNDQNCLILAAMGGSAEIVKYLLFTKMFDVNSLDNSGLTPALTAAKYGHQPVFDILVNERADLAVKDKLNDNCLIIAATGGNIQIVKYLLSLSVFDINSRGHSGWTAVMMACIKGHRQVFDLLRQRGADLTLTDEDGNGCLILASINNHSGLVRYLLSLEIFDINCRGKGGRTAVMYAALKGHVQTFFVLVSAGADLTRYDDESNSCSECAIIGQKPPIVRHFLTDDVTTANSSVEVSNTTLSSTMVMSDRTTLSSTMVSGAISAGSSDADAVSRVKHSVRLTGAQKKCLIS